MATLPRIDPKRVPATANERQAMANSIVEQVVNAYSMRGFFRAFGDPRRDIQDEIGVPKWSQAIEAEEFRQLYDRMPIAARTVEIFPKQMWMIQPEIYEQEEGDEPTPFEQRFDQVCASLRGLGGKSYYKPQPEDGNPLWAKCLEWDILSGIGRYGVLLLGFDDGAPMNQAVADVTETGSIGMTPTEIKESGAVNGKPKSAPYSLVGNAEPGQRNLLYARAFSEDAAQVTRWETNRRSPRYGQPVEYLLSLSGSSAYADSAGIGAPYGTVSAHWTRVLHLADNHHQTGGNPSLAPPRCHSVYDELMGLAKIYGASPEGYWKMCFTHLSFETHPQLGGEVDVNQTEMKDLIERVQNGLQKAWAIYGMSAKPIAPSVTDPTSHINAAIESICIKLGCPVRIFKGSERGELASTQDEGSWNDTLKEREKNHGTPNVVVPLIDRLILTGVLPVPERGYCCKWPDRAAMTAAEKAAVLGQRTAAYAAYVGGGINALIPEREYMTRFDSMPEEEADAILSAAAESSEADLLPEAPETPNAPPPTTPKQQPANPTKNVANAESFFATCDRDDRGRCLPGDGGSDESGSSEPKNADSTKKENADEKTDQQKSSRKSERAAGRSEQVVKEAQNIKVSNEPAPQIQRHEYDRIEEGMTDGERADMESAIAQRTNDLIEEHVNETFDPNIYDDDLYAEAKWTSDDVKDRTEELINKHIGEGDLRDSIYQALDDNYTDGPDGIEEVIDRLPEDTPESLVAAFRHMKRQARNDIEDARTILESEARDDYRESVANDWNDDETRREYLESFYDDHESRFEGTYDSKTWYVDPDGDSVLKFKTQEGKRYTVSAVYQAMKKIDDVVIPDMQFSDESGSFKVTGGGSAFEVFAKVVPAMVAYVQSKDLPAATFSAAEPSRQRLYDRMVKSIATAIPGYMAFAVSKPNSAKYYVIGKREHEDALRKLLESKVSAGFTQEVLANEMIVIEVLPNEIDPMWWDIAAWR